MEERRADVFVRRLIERVGLRRQRLFAAQPEVAERLLGLSRLAELATAWARREPHGSTRGFVAYLSAVAEAGVEPAGGEEPPSRRLGPGDGDRTRSRGSASTTSSCSGSRREAEWARIGWPARDAGSCSPGVERGEERRGAALALLRGGAGGAPRPTRRSTSEELFGPAEGLHATYRSLREQVLEASWRAGPRALRAAPRHGDRRQPGDRPLPGAAEAGGARPAPGRRADGGGDRGGQRPAAPGRDPRAAGRARRLLARLLPARLRARARPPAGADRRPRGALAGGLPAAPRRRPAQPLGLRPQPLPDLPAEVQVRARLRHPPGADDQPALRHPHPQRPRALPQGAAGGARPTAWRG